MEGIHKDAVETLVTMFGDVLTRDVIFAVVEYCDGDLEAAADAVMLIANDAQSEETTINHEQTKTDHDTDLKSLNADMTNNDTDLKSLSPDMTHKDPVMTNHNPNITNKNVDETENLNVTSSTDTQNIPNQTASETSREIQNSSNQTAYEISSEIQNSPNQTASEISSEIQNNPNQTASEISSDIQRPINTSSISLRPVPYVFTSSARNTGAVPKQIKAPDYGTYNPKPNWSQQIKDIVRSNNQGDRILIFMRGATGSGKSYLSKQIIDMCVGTSNINYRRHIFSTDDFFMVRGEYRYEKNRLQEAHAWNRRRVDVATKQGLSPIIVDNTNIELWEMEPYLRVGVANGYFIEVIEPTTPWAKKANQLLKKTRHDVPLHTIKRHLDNLRSISGSELINNYGLSYPTNMVPPVQRNLPEVVQPNTLQQPPEVGINQVTMRKSCDTENKIKPESRLNVNKPTHSTIANPEGLEGDINKQDLDSTKQQRYLEIAKQLEDILKVDEEWEKGDSWEENNKGESLRNHSENPSPKPARHESQLCNDWTAFLVPCGVKNTIDVSNIAIPTKAMKHAATSIEIGDTDLQNPKYKILNAVPKDINIFHVDLDTKKMPQTLMLDKGTMTNDLAITGALLCKNKEQHFVSLRKMFKNISKDDLWYIFDKCCGDVNWAVDIILDGIATQALKTVDDLSDSDTEDEAVEHCDCLSAYNIIPSSGTDVKTSSLAQGVPEGSSDNTVAIPQKKPKLSPSESSVQIKRQIEQNFVIADNHYSQHCLKIRKMRRGELVQWGFENMPMPMSDVSQASPVTEEENLVTTGPEFGPVVGKYEQKMPPKSPSEGTAESLNVTDNLGATGYDFGGNELIKMPKSPETTSFDSDDDNSSYCGSFDGREREMININVGWEFIRALDNIYNRQGYEYAEIVQPSLNVPVTLLNEINAFWMESLMTQMDHCEQINKKLLEEDEIFARRIQIEEEELARQGKEPEVPDFKEIMDMDLAVSLYQKDVAAQWREKEPTDLAARMTRDKLYNLFPDMEQDLLSQLLMAHDNNFKITVETLLMSTGKTDVLKDKNGLNKFVMEKELERQLKLLHEKQKALSETEWPTFPKGERVDMSTVQQYRRKADGHLQRRQVEHEKATEYINRGMPQVANYYSTLAHYHTTQYEIHCSLAATCLMQIHAMNSPNNCTIDLHFLRVVEARESLDIFLDSHIRRLKEAQAKAPHQGRQVLKLFFITGRGAHSQDGRPKVKPAVWKRLRDRGLHVGERNPGLLTAKVSADDKLSYQMAA